METPCVFMTPEDQRRLQALIESLVDSPVSERLGEEVDRAVIVAPGYADAFVKLGSVVDIETTPSGRVRRVRLMMPGEGSDDPAALSVLSPAGVALVGLKEGDAIAWRDGAGRAQTLRVLAIWPADRPFDGKEGDGHDDDGPFAA